MDIKASLGQSVSQFSLKLYSKLSQSNNLVFSPASIYIALSMVAIGSEGQTLEQLKQILSFENKQQLAQNTNQLQSSLVKSSKGITTQIANKIYQGLPKLGEEYEQLMLKNFGSAIENVDFGNYEQIRGQINQWVLQTTNQKIKDLLPPGSLDALTRMVLVNAIYFKGDWLAKFDSKDTEKSDFTLEYKNAGQKVQVDLMNREDVYDYFENQHYQYVSIPYKGGEYAMEVILPTNTLQQLEQTLSHETFLQARQKKKNIKVNIFLPKFKIQPEQTIAMREILSNLGIPHAFSNDANFSFMDPNNSIKISDVFHKAMIEVNEEGAEAAAATAVVMTSRCAPRPSPQFLCTKPFIYSITHIPTNTIMFLGKVTNPTKN